MVLEIFQPLTLTIFGGRNSQVSTGILLEYLALETTMQTNQFLNGYKRRENNIYTEKRQPS